MTMPKVLPPIENPSIEDVKKAEQFLFSHIPTGTIYTDEQRQKIRKLSRQIMMKRKTIQ